MLFNSPISSEKADRLINLLALETGSHILDAGCGSGEFLIRSVEKYNAFGIGIDTDESQLTAARESAVQRGLQDNLEFLCEDVKNYQISKPVDCGICLGATHAFASGERAFSESLKGLGAMIKQDGFLLIGEGFWMQEPCEEYLDFIGEPCGVYRTRLENVELAREMGLLPLYATTSNLDEWDHFEWSHHMRIEAMAEASPDDASIIEKRDFGRSWRTAYLKWGRGTMGFGFYLFKKS